MLKQRGLTKTGLAETLQIPKQNLNRIFTTQKANVMQQVASFLGVSIDELLSEGKSVEHYIDGFIEFDGKTYRIKTFEDFEALVADVQKKTYPPLYLQL